MSYRRALKLERLLIYSDVYNLGLTQVDIDHLQTVFTAFKQQAEMQYIYRTATKDYDLVLNFGHYEPEPYLALSSHDNILDKIGYPAIIMNRVYLKFLPKLSDILFLKIATGLIPNRTNADCVFNSIDELKKQVIEQELWQYTPDYYHPLNNEIINMFYACLNKKPPVINIRKQDYEDVPNYISHIVAVLQLPDDTRVAFYITQQVRSHYLKGYELSLSYYIVKVGDPAYNWTDENRYFSHFDSQLKKPRVFYIDNNPVFPADKDVIDNYRRGQNVLTIDNTTLDTLVKRWIRRQQDLQNEQIAIKNLEKKIKDRIDELASGGEFSYNDVAFRKNEFQYEGQVISCNSVEMKDILTKFSGHYSEDHLNFDRILDIWMHEFYKASVATNPIIACIGDVKIALKHKVRVTKDGIKTHVYHINNYRINKDEVEQVIGRAICFPDNQSFDEFCDTVSGCSLKYHKYIAGGINVEVHDEIFNQKMEFKISLERQKNKNFIVFNGKTFRVGNTNKLLTVLNARGMSRVIDILLDEKVVGMSGDDIKQLMTTGRQALIDQRAREDELLKGTMAMFGIEEIENFTAQNGRALSGYLVKGGLRNYVVESNKLLVYEYPSGRYICMVDKGQNEHINTARLVNRFFALSNDSRLAKEISTL